MENLDNTLQEAFGFGMGKEFIQRAVYSESMDCVSYTSSDIIGVSRRIDEFLTLIFDAYNRDSLVGFKVKGFKHFFNSVLKKEHQFSDESFIPLVQVLESMLTEVGKALTTEEDRRTAYDMAKDLAQRDNITVSAPMAA